MCSTLHTVDFHFFAEVVAFDVVLPLAHTHTIRPVLGTRSDVQRLLPALSVWERARSVCIATAWRVGTGALELGVASGAMSAIEEAAKTGEVKPRDVALATVVGAGLGGAGGKIAKSLDEIMTLGGAEAEKTLLPSLPL